MSYYCSVSEEFPFRIRIRFLRILIRLLISMRIKQLTLNIQMFFVCRKGQHSVKFWGDFILTCTLILRDRYLELDSDPGSKRMRIRNAGVGNLHLPRTFLCFLMMVYMMGWVNMGSSISLWPYFLKEMKRNKIKTREWKWAWPTEILYC